MQSRQCAEHPSPLRPSAVRGAWAEQTRDNRRRCKSLSSVGNSEACAHVCMDDGTQLVFNTSETLFSCCLLPILIILQTLVHSSNEDKRVNRMLCRPAPCHKHLLSTCLYKIEGAEEARTAWASLEILFTNRYCESKSLKMF